MMKANPIFKKHYEDYLRQLDDVELSVCAPILFLFNAADEQFATHASILYARRAEHFLDAECRVMVDWYLFEALKKAERV